GPLLYGIRSAPDAASAIPSLSVVLRLAALSATERQSDRGVRAPSAADPAADQRGGGNRLCPGPGQAPAGRAPGGARPAALCRRSGRGRNVVRRRPQPGVRDPAPRRAAHRRPAFVRTADQPTGVALAGDRPGSGTVQAEPAAVGDGAR